MVRIVFSKRKKLLFYLFLFFSFELGFAGGAAAQFSTSTHFLLPPGQSWEYLENETLTVTREVLLAPESVDDIDTWVLETVGGEVGFGQERYTNDALGLRFHRSSDAGAGARFSPPALLLPDQFSTGQGFSSSGVVIPDGVMGITLPYSTTTNVVGPATITVPAGTFDTVLIEVAITLNGFTSTDRLYLAEGVGVVRAEANIETPGGVSELVAVPEAGFTQGFLAVFAIPFWVFGARGRRSRISHRYTLSAAILWAAIASLAGGANSASAMPVDLNAWTSESYPAVAGFGPGDWQVSGDNTSVTQMANGQPTIFYSDFSAQNTEVSGVLDVLTASDDDYIGFVLGFDAGDTSSQAADFLLIDWKQREQGFNFSGPAGSNSTPGSIANVGLAVSRVTGIPTADELWGHVSFLENPQGGVTELARGMNFGNTGWESGTEYEFRFVYTPTALEIFLDDVLEVSIAGSFPDGRFGFYNFSQGSVRYSVIESTIVPEPSTALFIGLGLAGLGACRRKL